MHHTYEYHFGQDGDYILFTSWVNGRKVVHTRWLIPGTEMED